jgi:hypothetical protein
MNRSCWLVLMAALLLAATSSAQSMPPRDLMQALHCITTNHGGWLKPPLSRQKAWLASIANERMGYPHADRMVVVVYSDTGKGQMFDLSVNINAGKWRYMIENNGSFNLDNGNVDYVKPASDAWPPGRLEAFTQEAMRSERFMLRSTMLGPASRSATCRSYLTK